MQTETKNKKGFRFSAAAFAAVVLVLAFAVTGCSSNDSGNTNGNNSAGSSSDSNSVADNNTAASDSQDIKEGEGLVIPASEVSETAKFYPVTVDGTRMEVAVVKASDGTIRTAFNTCQVCNGSPKAYFEQSGNTLQCQNCGNKFPMDSVEVEANGCNPVPIFDEDKTVTDESITVSYDTLQANTYRFSPNWKQ